MKTRSSSRDLLLPLSAGALGAALALSAPADAQLVTGSAKTRTTFSIDNHGPTVGTMSCGSGPFLFQGDVLRPGAPFATPQVAIANRPCIRIRGGFGAGTLQLAGYPVLAEVDALSYGADAPLSPVNPPGTVFFSTDEYAIGFPQGGIVEPSLETEAPFGEIAASVFMDTGLPALPVSWVSGPFPNVQVIDGDGRPSASGYTRPGLGLTEPNFPGFAPDAGDNVDALDVRGAKPKLVLFSLDSGFPDPCSGVAWTGSAAAHGFSPAAIVASNGSGLPPVVWAPANALGLDLAGFGTDDLDALAVWNSRTKGYDPVAAPFGWNQGLGDMVVFSVRRGSAVIGQPDSLFGDPIEEGDLLMPPIAGGVSPFPAILVAAENLGLATRRAGKAVPCGPGPANQADDLDALDLLKVPAFDCDGNGREDALDILEDATLDTDDDGVLDSCVPIVALEWSGTLSPAFP